MQIERVFSRINHDSNISPSASKEVAGPISGERFRRRLLTREFAPSEAITDLPDSERKALDYLVSAVRRWAEVYSIQEGSDERAHFYPIRATKNQIIRASEHDPKILSPYTVVLKTIDGNFDTVPMHQAYSKIIESTNVVRLLKDATNATKDKKLKDYLRAKVHALQSGDWEEADKVWLARDDEPLIDIVIGFYDTYTDKFLGRKYAAEAWTGVLNREATEESQLFVDAFLENWALKTGNTKPKVKVRVDKTRIMSGQAGYDDGDLTWSANSLPCQIELRKEIGSKFTIFEPSFDDLYNARSEAFDKYIHSGRRSGIPKPLIRTGILRMVTGHEIGHSLIPNGIEKRIGAHKNWFNELNCDLVSLDGYFDIPQVFTHNREHEVAFATHFSNGFLQNETYKRTGKMGNYLPSHAIILKACMDNGVVQALDGCLTWKDVPEVRKTIHTLTNKVTSLGKDGTEADVQQFRNEMFDENIYEKILQTKNN